jgi:hypothetical protein
MAYPAWHLPLTHAHRKDTECGRLGAPELVERAASMHLRFAKDVVCCESNGPQLFVAETLAARGLPVLQHPPTGGGEWSMDGRFGKLEVVMGSAGIMFPHQRRRETAGRLGREIVAHDDVLRPR